MGVLIRCVHACYCITRKLTLGYQLLWNAISAVRTLLARDEYKTRPASELCLTNSPSLVWYFYLPAAVSSNVEKMSDDIDCLGDNRALQTALELSMLNLSNATYSPSASQDPSFSSYYSDSSLLSGSPKKSQNITQCVAVPSSEHVAEIVGRQGMFLLLFFLRSWWQL